MRYGVSVYIPSRNHAATLGAAIHSCVTESPVEVTVIDDASTDESAAIAQAAASAHPCVRFHQHTEKAPCWEQAAACLFPSFRGRHVVGLGADDELWPGIVGSVIRHASAPIVFHHYLIRRPGQLEYKEAVSMQVDATAALTPEQAQAAIVACPHGRETGIGSAIRHDWLEYLCEAEYWLMGPYADAIGYAAVAALAGCVYVPQVGAVFTIDDSGYGETHRQGKNSAQYHEACRKFLERTGLPGEVRAAILNTRGINA